MGKSNRFVVLLGFVACASLHARAINVRSVKQFDALIAQSPTSVVVFLDKEQGMKDLERDVNTVSRISRYKQGNLKFILVDAHRLNVSTLITRYNITEFPTMQVFLRTQPMRNAFMRGCFSQEQLTSFVERYLAQALTTELHRKQVRRELAQAPRPYYAADYYNPFYMMPYFNYSPPSDWPDEGPEWIGIEID